jgi:hypothetical protein
MDISNCHNLLAQSFKTIYYSHIFVIVTQDEFRLVNEVGDLPIGAIVIERLRPDQV